MKQELQLYINGKEIHFEESPQILFTFQQTDLTDPAAVKNSFTKTVTFSGTPENNQVFNSIYDLRRIQSYDEGYFNASQRIPFELYKGGELIEDGYAKLDSISKDNGEIKYNVTLYGGLGDFFYNLTYNEDGEKMQLADLAYTDSADPDDELSFILNKDAIYDAWNYLKNDTDEHKWGIINFMPAYNGIPKDFDANKILVNKSGYIAEVRVTDGTTVTTQNGFPETIGSYSTVNGYGLAETPQPMTEWDIRDLRSYLQRPCLRIKKLIEAICNPKNNGGYTVNLDKAFFDGNPYFNDAWMTLPMIPSAGSDTAKNAECKAVIGSDGKITLEGMEAGMFLNLSIKASFSCKTNGSTATPLRTGKRWTEDSGGGEGSVIDYYTNKTRYVQLVAYNAQNQVVGGSDIYSFYTSIWTNNFTLSPVYNATVKRVDGTYNKQGDGSYFFNSTSYPFTIENLEYTDGMYFKLVEKVAFDIYSDFNNAYELYDEENNAVSISQYYFTLYNDSVELDYGKGKSWKITKKVILNSEHTPCDYLLSYCKLFNLFIEKDRCNKVINIRRHYGYFTGEEVDIQDKIDRSKPIKINPITFDSKWYEFGYPKDDEVEFLQKYKNVYGSDYGKQRVNTGYNFNSEKKDVFKSLVFKNGLDVLEKSRYFRYKTYEFRQRECPTFLFTPVKYTLFNSNMETYDVTLSSPPIYSTSGFNGNADYYDAFSKVQLHKSDNEPINGSDVLVFFNGFVKPTGKGVLGSWTPLYYNITDDVPEMIAMNEKPCWIYTISANNSAGQRIAYRFTELPHFSRMIISNSYISKSWDIGKPRELFVPTARYGDVANIYGHHWSLYVSELYDIDTRVVDCYVKLSVGDLKDALRKFYWFDDSLWILTKISDFNYSSSETTKCTFVKVKNTYAY